MTEQSSSSAAVEALADELGAIRRRVLNVIGHELRTPATTIQGLAQQVCAATDIAEVSDDIGPALLRNANRLMALLDQMLIAAGIQTAIPVGTPEPVELSSFIASRWAATGGATLEQPPASTTVHASPGALQMALDAVLDNAAHHGMGPPVIRLAQAGDITTITVLSPGPPLHPEEIHLATEAFFRGERAVTARPGLGLGLAIARAIVEHMGGTVDVSQDDDGLITALTLPTGTAG